MFKALPARKQPRDRVLRCLNCFVRMDIALRAKRYTYTKCGTEYEIAWRTLKAKNYGISRLL
jgi:hypothetical protein